MLPSPTRTYRKKFMPVTYVIGDVVGVVESPVYAILKMSQAVRSLDARQFGGISDTTGGYPQGLSRLAAVL